MKATNEFSNIHEAKFMAEMGKVRVENDFQRAIKHLSEGVGWLYYHHPDSRKSNAGFPDTVCVGFGRCVIFELKVGKNKPSPDQERWLSALSKVPGNETYVWYPSHIGDILLVLDPSFNAKSLMLTSAVTGEDFFRSL